MKKTFSITILLFTIFQVCGQNNRLLIKNVNIIPLHINQQQSNRDVIIENGVISQIREHAENDTTDYDLGIIEGNGKYLIPSFADAHSHFPEEENLQTYFLMNLMNGVTTLRSMRGQDWHLEIDKNTEWTPNLILSSPPISRRDSLTEKMADGLISGYKKSGFDFIKILSVKDENTFDYLVKFAKNNNIKLAGHCPSNVGIFKICDSNIYQSIEHLGGFFQLQNNAEINLAIDRSISANLYHCPTLDWYFTRQVPEEQLRKRNGTEYLPKELIREWEDKITAYFDKTKEKERAGNREENKDKFQNRLDYLGHIYRQGGKLLLSPDASGIYGIPGFGVHTEMEHFANAGISNFDILKAASYNLSEMLNSENDWGTIKIGASSDLVLLNTNPLENIKNAKDINGVVFKGVFYSKSNLKKQLDR
ncbi:amidohydrolase family protein [Maribacter sp.]|uniref:amidohydrolase family protein n=1 Tax=Maribacter sp. TaxID=1897614 RepID=UPI0025C31B90|nr:amidohydrolase family protein [Maribacter sp.]